MIAGSRRREGASTGAGGSEKRPAPVRTLDEALFRAWQSGDLEAREAAWTLLWSALYSMAVGFCRRFSRDHATAEEWAASAIADASVEIERHVSGRAIAWPGQGPFVAWVSAHVIFRCRDQCRDSLRWLKRIVDVHGPGDDECKDRLGCLDSCPAMQEEDLIRSERDRNGLRRVVRELAALRELCRDSPSLVAVVDKMQTYLRECLIETLSPAVEATSFTLDELAEAARPESVEATKSALYQLIRQRLDIDRNTLYQRMKRIHALLRGSASLDVDRHSRAQRCSALVGHDSSRRARSGPLNSKAENKSCTVILSRSGGGS
jgi:DNA-directed RNA polymerase specialized sigma24 family protein